MKTMATQVLTFDPRQPLTHVTCDLKCVPELTVCVLSSVVSVVSRLCSQEEGAGEHTPAGAAEGEASPVCHSAALKGQFMFF